MSDLHYNYSAHRVTVQDEQAELLRQAEADPEDYGVPLTRRDVIDYLLAPAVEVALFLVAICGLLGMVYAPRIAKWLGVA